MEPTIKPARRKAARAFLAQQRALFEVRCLTIEPDRTNEEQVRARVAFAILSANAPFGAACDALAACKAADWQPSERALTACNMVPAKARYICALPRDCRTLLLAPGESWDAYRVRLQSLAGLGVCKASFAAALLYPTTCPFWVIDTHLCQLLFGATKFKPLGRARYRAAERYLDRLARGTGLAGFRAHWALWAWQSGINHDHNVFQFAEDAS